MTLDFPLRNMPSDVTVPDVRSDDDATVEATVGMVSLEVPFDLRQLISDLGTEGARVAVRILSGDVFRRP